MLKKYRAKIGLLLAIIALASCNALKKVGEDEYLLTKNTIYADGEKIVDEDINSLIAQKPNSNLFGYPLRLNLYNLAKENPDSSFQAWLSKKDKREQRLNKLLSEKQVKRLGESFIVSGYSNLFKRIGEPPAIIDTSRTRKTIDRLQSYYGSKGYFNNTADYTIVPTKRKKRAELEYEVNLGKPYIIDSLSHKISSQELDSIYEKSKSNSLVKVGEKFDLSKFNGEQERLTSLFRNTGIYNFQESSISYDVLRDTTLVGDDQKMAVQLIIKNLNAANDSLTTYRYRVNRFKKINIYADYQFDDNKDSLESIEYQNYTIFYKDKLKYRPKAITDAIFFEKDSIYRDLDYVRTNRQITNLNTFKYPNIEFISDSTRTQLISNIYLASRPKYSLSLDFDITRSNLQLLGTAFSASVITRNVFGGAETLSLSARGAIGFLSDNSSDETFTSELGGDINLTFPRIWLPFSTERVIPYYMLPQTRLSAGTSFQQNIGLDRQSLNSVLSYNWSPTNFRKNTFELFNIEFVRNTDPNDFFRVYNNTYANLDEIADDYVNNPDFADFYEPTPSDTTNLRLIIPNGTAGFTNALLNEGQALNAEDLSEVRSIEERRDRLTSNNLIFSSNFTYQKNNRQGISDDTFFQYRIRLESAGNLLSAMTGLIDFERNDNGQDLVFGVPFSQFVKGEFDYIKHWKVSNTNVIAFHSFIGLAVPYGNSNNIPFVRSYFAGGSNDNRAWNVYSLGPGRTQNINDFNEANFKIGLNLEYRFPIVGDVKGALFADGGNIWNVFDNVDDTDATFNGLSSLKDLALGTGFGLRYDFTYFVIRLDTGFKTYNPALSGSDRWFTNFNLKEAVFNIGINYPF
ncbi:MAG: BamA/TamA family outer membrane protein [Croceitalea sp.]|nr:BamA/TamA family outer membrane protein [Croceitalea sp.]NNC35455.1 BamA/TamA family outer membrane protein [Croceitalea sp.]NNM18282.1 BamA/TamA family outer membrane protein [Croceitalea sp.]